MKVISPNLNLMIKACETASKYIIKDFGEVENLQVSKKGPRDFVTKTDKKVEQVIINELSKNKKGYSFITEETGVIENKNKDNVWIIDPIDGTNNFLHGIPHFAISIALRIQNEIVIGLVFDPLRNDIFYAEKNNGSYFNNYRIRVSKRNNIDDCLFATSHDGARETTLNVRHTGCAALDLAYVGAGKFDGYYHSKINLWDIAAGLIIVREAGGEIDELDHSAHKNINLKASNGVIHQKMLANIKKF
jgi:myo-inositol-1(or 4)-monophosphatase